MARSAAEFYAEAAELFGLDRDDARELRSMLAEAYGFDYREQALVEYAEEASDLLDFVPGIQQEIEAQEDREYTEEAHREYEAGLRAEEYEDEPAYEPESQYELDVDWPDDEWLEADDWYEVSGEYEED